MAEEEIPIGALSRRTGCNIESIRYYERIGVLPHPRRNGCYRCYRPEEIGRLVFVRRARQPGFTLGEVRALLGLVAAHGNSVCAEVREIAAAHLADVRMKIADLAAMERILADSVRRCDAGELQGCPLIAALSARAESRPHVYGGTIPSHEQTLALLNEFVK